MTTTTIIGACPHDCPDTCSMITTVEDGRAVSVAGNKDHPFTQGRLCVKVNDYQERVYSEQRVLYPMRRAGPKGSGEFSRISWDDALSEIVVSKCEPMFIPKATPAVKTAYQSALDKCDHAAKKPDAKKKEEATVCRARAGRDFARKYGAKS